MSEPKVYPSEYWVTNDISEPSDISSATLIVKRKGKAPLMWSISPLRYPEVCYDNEANNFDWEPLPSNRTNEYLKTHRFETAEEAIEIAKKIIEEGILV